jgi:hypothetical protein
MLKDVPDFDRLWQEWVETFHKLMGVGRGSGHAK